MSVKNIAQVKTTVRRTSETAIAARDNSFFLNVVSGAMVVIKSLSLACARVPLHFMLFTVRRNYEKLRLVAKKR